MRKQPDDLGGRAADARLTRKMQQQELDGENWDTLKTRLARASSHDTKLFRQLKALFILEPASTTSTPALLTTAGSASDASFQTLAGALASAGTPEAQRALRDTLEQVKADAKKSETIIGLLGLVTHPTEETERGLVDLAAHPSSTSKVHEIATLALGTLASSLAQTAPERSGRLLSHLEGTLAEATTTSERGIALAALGNTAAPEAAPPLLDALEESEHAGLRATAALGLRSVHAPAAGAALVQHARSDVDADVRAAAATALREHELPPRDLTQLAEVARTDASESVRVAALTSLGARGPKVQGVMEALTWAQENDRSPEVRKIAGLLLTRLTMSG